MSANIGNVVGFVDKRQSSTANAGSTASQISNAQNYEDLSSLDSRLSTINGSYYTSALLAKLSYNDKVFALRHSDDLQSL